MIAQLSLDQMRISATKVGAAAATKLPIMFMLPASVPQSLPPTSMQVAQLVGMTRSFAKLAIPRATIAQTGSLMCTDRAKQMAAPAKPVMANRRREIFLLPVSRSRNEATTPQHREPRPPKNSGKPASRAVLYRSTPRASSKYVGSQVT